MKQLLIERWRSFDQKEQTFLGGCGVVLLVFLFYAYLWLPTQLANEKFAKEIPKKQSQLNLMKLQAAEIESKRNQHHLSKTSKEGLNDSLRRSAETYGILLAKLNDQPESAGKALQVQIASTSFDAWIKWTAGLHANQGVRVAYCLITPNPMAGEVKIDAILESQN